jgi:hypothetical protein
MEKITNRDKFFQNFHEFCNKVNLNPGLIKALSEHHYFSDDMKTVLVSEQINIFLYSIIIQ